MIESIQRNVAWRAIPIAGIAAGTAFLIFNLLLTPLLLDIDPVLTLKYFGSLVLGKDALMEDTTSNLVIGVIMHYLLSILFTLLIAIVVHRYGMTVGLIGGAILGLAIYLIMFYAVTVFFDWIFGISSTVMIMSYIVFGAVAGAVYEYLDRYDRPFEPFDREGI